ncbi:MAG TPA: T9SS type A sorting domain-containing protein [Flavobacteriales bacterium]|nr:T9SS type A sorting domain-containing protein [Flavobacteriales bacterium]
MTNTTTTLTTLFLAFGATTFAQPGSLDNSFSIDGKVTTAFGTGDDSGQSVAIQLDGKIVVVGTVSNGTDSDLAIARYSTDGTLDNSFSGDGKVSTDFGTVGADGNSVTIQSNGKIIVAGSASNGTDSDFVLARYNTDGTPDNGFGVGGKVSTAFGTGNDFGMSVAVQPDARIVVAGNSYNGTDRDFATARYNTDGTLDNSFSGDGKVTTAFGTGNDYGSSVAIQPDGRIVVAGYAYNGTNNDLALARYNTDGTLDNSFSGDGKVITAFGTGDDAGYSVAIQPDGKIVVAGSASNGTVRYFAIARYNTDGTLDNSFSGGGIETTNFGTGTAIGISVAIQPDGKIVVAGDAYMGSNSDFALARYHTDGSLDNSFGVGGKVTTAFGTANDFGRSVAIQPDGKIVVAGSAYSGTNSDFAVARYLSGLNIGVIEFSLADNAPLIYPNPIDERATLEFTLQNDETISIHLLDMQGRTVRTFIDGKYQPAGEHRLSIDVPEALPSGAYLIVISSLNGKFAVQVVK